MNDFTSRMRRAFASCDLRKVLERFCQEHPGVNGVLQPELWPAVITESTNILGASLHVVVMAEPKARGLILEYRARTWWAQVYVTAGWSLANTTIGRRLQGLDWSPSVWFQFESVDPNSDGQSTRRVEETDRSAQRFLDIVRGSFTATELRDTADTFFSAHPNKVGYVDVGDWPVLFTRPLRGLSKPPTWIVVEGDAKRRWLVIEYAGSFFYRGIIIASGPTVWPTDNGRLPRGWVEWEKGIYTYYSP